MKNNVIIDAQLFSYATVRQLECLEAINQHGGIKPASLAMGVTRSTLQEVVKLVKRKAEIQGYSPAHDMTRTVPDSFVAKGVSSYFNKEGKLSGQWVKASLKQEVYMDSVIEGAKAFMEEIPLATIPDGPKDYSYDVIPWLQIGDAHLGMLAHAAEIGENFDLKIAERELCGAIGMLIDEMPACERMVINDLGDFTHYENYSATTEASGHQLDYDSRFPKMIRMYAKVMRFIVDKTMTKARFVDIIVNQGNHSRTNDIWMAELLRMAYANTDRVNVLNNDNVFIPYRMGNTLVMTHHSDKCRPKMLSDVMITDFKKDFGETEFHYIDIGHVHHGMVMKEHPSIFIESFNHLASLDRWAHDSGYRNRKSITVILRSRTYGEIGRRVLPIQEIRDRLAKAEGVKVQSYEKPVYTV